MLTQEELKEIFHYDPSTGVFVRKSNGRCTGGSWKSTGCVQLMVMGKNYRAHQLAWLWVHGQFSKHPIKHLNRVRSDNRIANLYIAKSKNAQSLQTASLQNRKISFL